MAASIPGFDSWLSVKLKSLNTDESIFGSYIKGILEGEESQEEKNDALEGILLEIVPNDEKLHAEICQEIFQQWGFFHASKNEEKSHKEDMDTQIARIMEQQAQCVVMQKQCTEEEKKFKQTILSQYAEVSDGEEERTEDTEVVANESGDDKGLARNTNAEDVMKAERAKKEKLRQDGQKKKEKDKEDREKQKQLQQERKEKEKKRTQKSEKRR